jgi:hypothetical protein
MSKIISWQMLVFDIKLCCTKNFRRVDFNIHGEKSHKIGDSKIKALQDI